MSAITTQSVDTSNFIRVPPQLLVQFGTYNKRAWFLDLEYHVGDFGLLFVTLPGCQLCAQVANLLPSVQKYLKEKHNKILMIYYMEAGPHVVKSQTILRNMNVTHFPSLFLCKSSTGRLISFLDGQRDVRILTQIDVASLAEMLMQISK